MNDAPPVTSAVFPAQNDSVVATPRLPPDSLARPDVFENFQIFLKLGHSIIRGCGGPCRRFHRLQLPPVRHQVPDHADEFPVVVRIGSYRKALLHAKRPNVAFPGSYGNNRFSDRKSTRLNSSHGYISYAVFCLKKKKNTKAYVLPKRTSRFLTYRRSSSTVRRGDRPTCCRLCLYTLQLESYKHDLRLHT